MREREKERENERENAREKKPNAYEIKSEQCFLVADTRLHIA